MHHRRGHRSHRRQHARGVLLRDHPDPLPQPLSLALPQPFWCTGGVRRAYPEFRHHRGFSAHPLANKLNLLPSIRPKGLGDPWKPGSSFPPLRCEAAPGALDSPLGIFDMPLGDFVEPGTRPRPLAIGRVTRLGFGILLGFAFTWNLLSYRVLTDSDFPLNTYWIGVVIAWWYSSDLVVVGFGLRWGRWPQFAAIAAVLALVVADLVAYGEIWDLPLAWAVFLYTEFVFGFFAISFVLAAALAVPG